MIIRKARSEDSEFIANQLLLAMDEIVFKFIGIEDGKKAKEFILYFVEKESNQYSYQNCWVFEIDKKVIATVNIYDGSQLETLRRPVVEYIRQKYNSDFQPEDETQDGEFYIDCLAVNSDQQGKGIGKKLLQFVIDEYANKRKQTLGLLVDEEKLYVKELYLKMGFKNVGKRILFGKKMEHFVFYKLL